MIEVHAAKKQKLALSKSKPVPGPDSTTTFKRASAPSDVQVPATSRVPTQGNASIGSPAPSVQTAMKPIVKSGTTVASRSPAISSNAAMNKTVASTTSKISQSSLPTRTSLAATQVNTPIYLHVRSWCITDKLNILYYIQSNPSLRGPPMILPDLRSQIPQKVRQVCTLIQHFHAHDTVYSIGLIRTK